MHIEHTLHVPRRNKMEIPYAGDRQACIFCGSRSITPGKQCRCGVWYPSENSFKRPRPTKRRKTPPSTLPIYRPLHDGIADRDPHQDHDELAPYRAQLDKIHDPRADDDSVPWEE